MAQRGYGEGIQNDEICLTIGCSLDVSWIDLENLRCRTQLLTPKILLSSASNKVGSSKSNCSILPQRNSVRNLIDWAKQSVAAKGGI